jgi:hypothetical protein
MHAIENIVGLTEGRHREREKGKRSGGCADAEWFFGKRNLENLSIICTILSARGHRNDKAIVLGAAMLTKATSAGRFLCQLGSVKPLV